jgi:hypothetical protein
MNLYHPIVALILLMVTLLVPSSLSSPTQSPATDTYTPRTADYNLREVPLSSFLGGISQSECIEVRIDPSVEEFVNAARVSLRLNKAAPMRAMKEVIESQHLNYEYIDYKTLIIFREAIPKSVNLSDMIYRDIPLSAAAAQIAGHQGFKGILLHPGQYGNLKVSTELRNISIMRGFEEILKAYGFTYQRRDCGTIIVFRDESSPAM